MIIMLYEFDIRKLMLMRIREADFTFEVLLRKSSGAVTSVGRRMEGLTSAQVSA
jgi:hypothetical protein